MTSKIAKEVGYAVKKLSENRGGGWYGPHMAAASRAITERIPLVDLVLEVRDARIPFSSQFKLSENNLVSSRSRILVLNKIDLANKSLLKDWITYFNQKEGLCIGVNSHNKDSVKELLNFLQAQVRQLNTTDHSRRTRMAMLVGIPNVGKSALANSLHQIGRISAEEKGKLRHATVSPHPGETKDISSLKIASHPNIYVLDTPSILPPHIYDIEVCSKLALTGAIRDCLVGETELARYFLGILNLNEECKKWAKFTATVNDGSLLEPSSGPELVMKKKRVYPTDHTQDFMVQKVRQTLFEVISCFHGNLEQGNNLERLIETQFTAMKEVFQIRADLVCEGIRWVYKHIQMKSATTCQAALAHYINFAPFLVHWKRQIFASFAFIHKQESRIYMYIFCIFQPKKESNITPYKK